MAKNSAFMYVQMAVKMLIGLYTVRVILHALGTEDYGIYNVVGGFVSMFTFITSTLVSASMRFFAYAIGKGEYGLLNRYFNSTVLCFIILSAVLLVVVEVFGFWFVNYKMVVSAERLEATNWVLQFAIISFIVRILAVPFKSMIVAHEKMIVFAVISVMDSILLLGIAFLIQTVDVDRLKFYSVCICGVAFISTFLYAIWCHFCFPDASKIRLHRDSSLLKEILCYSGWYMFGTMATVVRSQGINILLNLFFSPIVNAARGIAYQINNALNQFVNSFYNAVRPQITKLTAAEENEKMLSLVFNSSIISYLLTCLIAIPLLIEMPFVLNLWLMEVPEYTIIFSRLVIVTAMIDTLGYPLATAVCASGNIRNFQVITGGLLMLNLPISYLLLDTWPHPYLVFYVSIGISVIVQIVRIFFMKRMFDMSLIKYTVDVVMRLTFITILTLTISYYLAMIWCTSVLGHIINIFVSLFLVLLSSWYFGMRKSQRNIVLNYLGSKFSHNQV